MRNGRTPSLVYLPRARDVTGTNLRFAIPKWMPVVVNQRVLPERKGVSASSGDRCGQIRLHLSSTDTECDGGENVQ